MLLFDFEARLFHDQLQLLLFRLHRALRLTWYLLESRVRGLRRLRFFLLCLNRFCWLLGWLWSDLRFRGWGRRGHERCLELEPQGRFTLLIQVKRVFEAIRSVEKEEIREGIWAKLFWLLCIVLNNRNFKNSWSAGNRINGEDEFFVPLALFCTHQILECLCLFGSLPSELYLYKRL